MAKWFWIDLNSEQEHEATMIFSVQALIVSQEIRLINLFLTEGVFPITHNAFSKKTFCIRRFFSKARFGFLGLKFFNL